ncbi:MAG TPA: hypothetical protein VIL09_07125 [Microvirga sp.]
MEERHRIRAHVEECVAALQRTIDEYEAAVADASEMALRLEDLGYQEQATVSRAAAREHQVKLMLHKGQVLVARHLLDELLRDGV